MGEGVGVVSGVCVFERSVCIRTVRARIREMVGGDTGWIGLGSFRRE